MAALIAAIFATYPGCPFVRAEFPELDAVASHYRALGGLFLVGEQAGALVGCLGIAPTTVPGLFELSKVYVAVRARCQGLARALLARGQAFARTRGALRLDLFTDTRFVEGHRFYEAHGFIRLPGVRYLADAGRSWEYHYARAL